MLDLAVTIFSKVKNEMVETEFLEFEFKEQKPKTEVWTVRNKHHGDILGEIRYYPQWRQYCFIIPQEVMKETGLKLYVM